MNLKQLKEKLRWLDPFTYVDEFVIPRLNPKGNKTLNTVIYFVSAFVFAFAFYSLLGFLLGTNSPMIIVMSGSMEPGFYRGDIMVLAGATAEQTNAQEVNLDRFIGGKRLTDFAETFCEKKGSNQLVPCQQLVYLFAAGQLNAKDFETKKIRFKNGEEISLNKKGDMIVYWSTILNEPLIHRVVAKVHAKDGTFFLTKGDSVNNPLIDQEANMAFPVPGNDFTGKAIFKIPLLGYFKLLLIDDPLVLILGCNRPAGCPLP